MKGAFSERLYRLLLRAYPRSFRRRYEREMLEWFRADGYDGGDAGSPGMRRWLRILADLAASVPREHARAAFGSDPGRPESLAGRRRGEREPLAHFWQDLRIASRSFARRPGFLLLATVTIATGIGSVTTIFSVVHAVLLTPLPYPESGRLVRLGQRSEGSDRIYSMSYLDFRDIQERTSAFEAIAATRTTRTTVIGDGGPESLSGAYVAAEFFDVMGVGPVLGRVFTPEEDRAEAAVVVLSHGIWRSRWGANPAVVGASITLDGEAFTVLGVMPPDFVPPEALGMRATAVWLPLARVDPVARDSRSDGFLSGVGRLAGEATAASAQAELDAIGASIRESWPEESGHKTWGFAPLIDQTVGSARTRLASVLGAVVFLLLIACVNVANLMLVRSSERAREFAVRTAVGASRGRLVRQLFSESLLIGAAGAVAGVALAVLGVDLFVAYGPGDVPRLSEVALDGSVVAFAVGTSMLATIAFGLAPALVGVRGALADGLREATQRAGVSRSQERLRGGLVVVETSLALVLVVGAGLLAGSFVRMNRVELGFEPEGVYAMTVTYPVPDDPEGTAAFFDELVGRVGALPGARAAGATAILPLGGGSMYQRVFTEGGAAEGVPLKYQEVSDNYFEVVGIPVSRGRAFGAQDFRGGALVAVVSASAARLVFGDADPLGRAFTLGEDGIVQGTFQVVGVVGDARLQSVQTDPEPELYLSARQVPRRRMDVVMATDVADVALLDRMRDEVWALRPDIPVLRRVALSEQVEGSIAPERFYTWLLVGFAAVAMLLALVGIYGTLSYTVAQRMREVGVRMAIGASAVSVVALVVRRGVVLAGAGVLLGLAAALPLMRLLEAFVFGVSPSDPATLAGAGALVLVTAVLASLVPARRATRMDPTEVLRGD